MLTNQKTSLLKIKNLLPLGKGLMNEQKL